MTRPPTVAPSSRQARVPTPRPDRSPGGRLIAERRRVAQLEGSAEYLSKRAEFIAAAALEFRAKGYQAATVLDIARRVDFNPTSLYYYVASKEELFQECIQSIFDENLGRAETISLSPLSPHQKLADMIAMLAASQVDHYPYLYVYVQEDMRQVQYQDARWAMKMVNQTRRIEGYFMTAIAEGIASGIFRPGLPIALVANTIFGMLMWPHRWFVPSATRTAAELTASIAGMFFDGIATERSRDLDDQSKNQRSDAREDHGRADGHPEPG